MSQEQWSAVDDYVGDQLVGRDAVLDAAQHAAADAGLPNIAVSPVQGKLLHLLARMVGAKRILELGTLGGYSTIWMARALPKNGRLITLESDKKHAAVAQSNFIRAGLAERIDLRLGPALETLPKLAEESREPFDLIFIDADKANTPAYFEWSLKLSRPGGVIIVDNVIRKGAMLDPSNQHPDIVGTRALYKMLATDPRIDATAIQTVGVKGWDGLAVILVK